MVLASEEKPDLILLTETWCSDHITDAFLTIPGYEIQVRVDRINTDKGRGGGLLVYSRTGIPILVHDTTSTFNQYCSFKVYDLTVFLIYRSPSSGVENLRALEELIVKVEKNTILIGDFNLPDLDWEKGTASGRTRKLLEVANDNMLEQLVKFPTHLKGNILDLVLTNVPERVHEVEEVGRLGASDHVAILTKVGTGVKKEKNVVKYLWGKADWEAMEADLERESWQELDSLDAEVAWKKLKEKLNSMVEDHVPKKRRRNHDRPGWLNQEIVREIRRKKKQWRMAKQGIEVEKYKETEKKVRNLIRNAKRRFEKKLAQGGEDGHSKRQFFSYVRTKTKSRPGVGPLKDKEGKMISGDKEMTEMLNTFFVSVFTREDTRNIPVPRPERLDRVLTTARITAEKVKRKVKRLRSGSAAGPDGVGPQLLQKLIESLDRPLAAIMQKSLDSGVVPRDWRTANVTPIFKKGSRSAPGNYRPVSLTSVCCKVMEQILKDAIVEHLDRNGIMRKSQHGFLRGRSCMTNLISFMDKITEALDRGEPADVVFLDFAKAFDKVPVARLLEKVKAHGIRGNVLRWIRSWLTDRQQRVVLNGNFSEWIAVLSGVPQGSVLGPLLFIIFINDLDEEIPGGVMVSKFADDTKVARTVATEEGRAELQEALRKLELWAARWGMEFNILKCKVMHFGRNNPRHDYTMNGRLLEKTEEERDLGVVTMASTKPAAQCAKAAQTAQAVLGQIARAFHFRDKEIFLGLYRQYIRPHLEFSVQAWAPWCQRDKDMLENVQRRAVKMISGLRGDSYEERLKELGLTSLEERRHRADMALMHSVMHGRTDICVDEWFTRADTRARATRAATGALNVVPRHGRLEIRKNFFTVRATSNWNSVPSEVKQVESANGFKMAYAKHREQNN